MKKFVLKLILFTITIIILAYALQWFIDTGLKKSNYSPEYKEWYEIYKSNIKADIIIQGSSRSWVHFSPKALEDEFHLPAYNLGINGQQFPLQKWRFDMYMRYNKKPRYIIQSVDVNFFNNPNISYDFNQFIPYLNNEFENRFKNHSFFTELDFNLPLYKYTHTDGAAASGLLNFFNKSPRSNGKYKGFKAYAKNWNANLVDSFKLKNPKGFRVSFDNTTYALFNQFIQQCKKQNIELILVYSPVHASLQNQIINRDSIKNIFLELSKNNNIKYLDYSEIPLCSDTAYFYNANHMNAKGVEIFNKILVSDLKKIIK